MTPFFKLFILLCVFSFSNLFSQVPTITSFSPTSGLPGATVVLTGTNFSTSASSNIVYFGAAKANVIGTPTATSCTVTVPTGATYERITLSVGLKTGYSSKPFIVTQNCPGPFTTGAFPSSTYTLTGGGVNPYYSALGDFDLDGKLDYGLAQTATPAITWYRNTTSAAGGVPTFVYDDVETSGLNPRGVATGDLNGDGKLDLVNYNSNVSSISVYKNQSTVGNISFVAAVEYDAVSPTSTGNGGVCIGDLDGDGKPEIVGAGGSSDTIVVYRNLVSTSGASFTSGSFASPVKLVSTDQPGWVYMADIDGDGKTDLVTTNEISDNIAVFRNLSTSGTISFASPVYFSAGNIPDNFAIGDIDMDGKPDVVIVNNGSTNFSVFRNTSVSGTISFATRVNFTTTAGPRDLDISDINGDGSPDVVVMTTGTTDAVCLFENTSTSGTISFATRVDLPVTAGSDPRQISVGDLNQDGLPDMLIMSQVNDNVTVFSNNLVGAPVLTSASTKTICSGSSVNLALTAIPSAGNNFSWAATSNANVGGESTTNQTINTINNTLTNTTGVPQTVIYTVNATSTTCPGGVAQPQTVTVTVNPAPIMTSATTYSVCTGVTMSHALTSDAASTYSWLTTNNANTTGESTTAQISSTINNLIVNSTTGAQALNYTVTPTSTSGCVGSTQTVTVTVHPAATMTSATSAAVCSGTALALPLTSNLSSTYSWIATNNANTSGESTTSQSGSSINNTIINSTTSSQIVSYSVTPTTTPAGCVGTVQTVTVTVYPLPSMTSSSTVAVCSGTALNLPLTSNVASNYTWIAANNASTTGESTTTQTTSTINNTITSSTSTAQILSYTVIPTSSSGCLGTTQTVTATVNPTPAINNRTATGCTGFGATPVDVTDGIVPAGTTYSWPLPTVTGGMTGVVSASGVTAVSGSPVNPTNTAQTATYTVTPLSGSCTGNNYTLTVTMNPRANITTMTTTSCTGVGFSATPVNSTNGVVPAGTTYSWSAPTVTGGMTGGATGSAASSITGTLTNSTNTAQTATYTISTTSGTCAGNTFTLTATINPKPAITAMTGSVCSSSGFTITPVNTTNGVVPSGTTYSWSAPTVTGSMTGGATGSGASSVTGILTNTTSIAQTATYTVTPTSGSCSGSTFTITVTVNPKPVMTSASATSVCSGTALSFALTSGAASTYSWLTSANADVTGETTTATVGSTLNNTLVSSLTTAATVIYTVTPTGTAGSCVGTAQNVTVTVNPKPVMTSATSTSVCSATALSFPLTSGATSTYSWLTSANANVTGETTTATVGSTLNNTLVSSLTTATTVVYTVTPTGTAGSCVGAAQNVTVTVNPKPVMTSGTSTSVCSGITLNFPLTSGAAATYAWNTSDNVNTTGESVLGQSGATINNTITSSLTTATTLVYTVTPTGTTGACVGTAQNVTVTVNPKPTVSGSNTLTICSGNSVALSLTSATPSSFSWLATNNVNTNGESTTAQVGSTITNTLTSTSTSIQAVTYTITPTSTTGSCVGTAKTVTVTIDNLPPVANAGADISLCPLNINLEGNDPFPGTGTWSLVSQSAPTFTTTVYYDTAYNSVTGFAGMVTGNNATLKWTVNSQLGVCPSTNDNVVITKMSCPLTAAFTTSTNNLCIKPGDSLAVVYTDNSSAGVNPPITSWNWTFNGATRNPNRTGPGPHTVYYAYNPSTIVYITSLSIVDNNSNPATSAPQNITVRPMPSAPGIISGLTSVCQNDTVNYSVASVLNADSYSWVFPSGASSVNPNNIASTIFGSSAQSGFIKVAGVNTCGTGDTSYLSVSVNQLPGSAGVITGTSPVCQGETGASYSIGAVTNATSYNWVFPSGGTTLGTTTNITADFSTSASAGTVTVTPVNACGNGTSSTFVLAMNLLPSAAGTISGPTPVCQGQTLVPYSISPVANALSYNWSFPSGGTASGTTSSITSDFSTTASSGTITVTPVNACGNGTANTFVLTVNPLPGAAGTITGPLNMCAGSVGTNFSVAAIANATGYTWTFPAGLSSVNPNNIASTDATNTASSGVITVAGTNTCGTGVSNTFNVIVDPLPDAASMITGISPVCQGENGVAYSTTAVTNATSYNWSFPSGGTASGTTTSITADFSTTASAGTVTLTPVNACGNGASSTFVLDVNLLPSAAGTISGATPVCQGQSLVSYSVSPVANALSYNWSFPSGGTTSGTTNSITADFDATASSGVITVTPVNACGNGVSNTFVLSVNPLPSAAGLITGPASVCAGTNGANYSVASINNASGYTWTYPSGVSSVNPNNISATDFNTTASSGNITVAGTNACGTGVSNMISIIVDPLPDAAGAVTGISPVCQGVNGVSFSVGIIPNATSYIWTFPSGITSSGVGNNIAIDLSTSAQSGSIEVSGVNACGTGVSSIFSISVDPLPAAPAFSGTTIISGCPLADSVLFSFAPAANAVSYDWSLPANAYSTGSTTDDSIYVGFTSAASDTIKVASVNACGISAYSYMLIDPLTITTPSICMVTVDSLSNYNEIYWDKSGYALSDTFLVYRDTANNNYALIGRVPYDSLSMFADTLRTLYAANGDPNVSSWRYKIAVQDSCGQMSAMSTYHQTMFMQDAVGNFSWNHYEIEGQTMPVPVLSAYVFQRDDIANGSWNDIQTLSASSTAYTDPSYVTFQTTADWRAVTQWSISCDPTLRINGSNQVQGTIVKSRSNIKTNRTINPNGIGELQDKPLAIKVYPNPAKETINIELPANNEDCMIELHNLLGQTIYSVKTNQNTHSISVNNFDEGVYIVKVKTSKGISSEKVIIHK